MFKQAVIDKILTAKTCGDIFERDQTRIKSAYHEYAKAIHPDICKLPGAEKAFDILNRMYKRAMDLIQTGTWDQTGKLYLDSTKTMSFLNEKPFELGTIYSGATQIAYVFDVGKEKWADRLLQSGQLVSFKDNKMRDIYKGRVSSNAKIKYILPDKRTAIVLEKKPEEYPMDLFLSAYRRRITTKDMAWMISRMVDLCCFLSICGIVHNGIEAGNLYICPNKHYICLYGGWQYATRIDEKMAGTTKNVYKLMPTSARTDKIATPITDMECVRDLFRTIVKDGYLDFNSCVPQEIMKWIDAGSTDDPIYEYERWNQALDKAYGKRVFQVFSANADEIYSKH